MKKGMVLIYIRLKPLYLQKKSDTSVKAAKRSVITYNLFTLANIALRKS